MAVWERVRYQERVGRSSAGSVVHKLVMSQQWFLSSRTLMQPQRVVQRVPVLLPQPQADTYWDARGSLKWQLCVLVYLSLVLLPERAHLPSWPETKPSCAFPVHEQTRLPIVAKPKPL